MARTDTLGNFLTDVADAIREKSGTSEPIQASDFDTAISNIPSGGSITKVKPYYFTYRDDSETTEVDISKIIDGSALNTFQFRDMSKLKTLNLSGIECDVLTSMQNFCYNDVLLETIDFSNTSFPSIKMLNNAFTNCAKIKRLDLSGITGPVNNIYGLFSGCTSLEHVDISGIDLTGITTSGGGVFNAVDLSCEIIVKDSASKTWMQTNFAGWSNVKTKAEYEAE